jgi:hypothetical protein
MAAFKQRREIADLEPPRLIAHRWQIVVSFGCAMVRHKEGKCRREAIAARARLVSAAHLQIPGAANVHREDE